MTFGSFSLNPLLDIVNIIFRHDRLGEIARLDSGDFSGKKIVHFFSRGVSTNRAHKLNRRFFRVYG